MMATEFVAEDLTPFQAELKLMTIRVMAALEFAVGERQTVRQIWF
jgi:hypothetical protein